MDVPPLWHYRCATPAEGDFIKWHYAKCVTVPAYRNGAWPVIKDDTVQPSKLGSACIRSTTAGLLVVICPLCYDIRVFESGLLERNKHYECPGHNGSAHCPGYIYKPGEPSSALSSGATCSIQ